MTRVDKYLALAVRVNHEQRPEVRENMEDVMDKLWQAMRPDEIAETNARYADIFMKHIENTAAS